MNWWGILAILLAARTGLELQFQTIGSMSQEMSADLGLNFTQVGTLIGLLMLPGLFLSLPTGYVGRFAGDRAVACFGLGGLALGGIMDASGARFRHGGSRPVDYRRRIRFSTVFFKKMITDWFAGKEIATAMGDELAARLRQKPSPGKWRFHAASAFCFVGLLLVLFYRPPPGQRSQLGGHEFVLVSIVAAANLMFRVAQRRGAGELG